MHNTKLIESRQQVTNFNDLFKWLVNQANSLLSARIMLILWISKNAFHSDIYTNLIQETLDFAKYEVDYINNSLSQYVLPISWVNERTIDNVLGEVNRPPNFYKWLFDQNKVNEHHIIANMKNKWWFEIWGKGKIIINTNSYRDNFLKRHNTFTKKNSNFLIKWTDTRINTIPLTIVRHNKWLNTRYPWNFFPHLQISAEYEFIWVGMNNIYNQWNKNFENIKTIIWSCFEDLYKEDSYEFRKKIY